MSRNEFLNEHEDSDQEQINAYRLIKKLGEGNYASVYSVEFLNARKSENNVKLKACKIIDTSKLPAEYTQKFLPRELEILRQVSHPHIIQVYSVYQKKTKYLIFMRLAEKGDLLDFIRTYGSIEENQARLWTKQIGLAIQYLHELEIAHRDLKCENILITGNLNAKLTDFGFARYVVTASGAQALSTTHCGSISYCAPEIVKGISYNPKISDIWSLGVVIYVMLNNALPFLSDKLSTLYEQQMNKKWKFKPQTHASKQVKQLLTHLLEPIPQERYVISEVLNSSWIYMDIRVVGMNEEESLALISAKEERKRMEQNNLRHMQHKYVRHK